MIQAGEHHQSWFFAFATCQRGPMLDVSSESFFDFISAPPPAGSHPISLSITRTPSECWWFRPILGVFRQNGEISMGFRGFSPGRGRDNMRTGRWREEIQFVKHSAAHIASKHTLVGGKSKKPFLVSKKLTKRRFPL